MVAAVIATVLDASLLQRSRSYFTGGFLSADHVSHWTQGVAFFVGSLLADLAVLSVPSILIMWACGRWRLDQRVSAAVAIGAAVAGVALADVAVYQLQGFLGDVFDFDLMFDLVGRNPRELLAVTSAHIVPLAGALLAAALVMAVLVWALRSRRTRNTPAPFAARRALLASAALLALGATVSAVQRSGSDVLDNGLRRKPTGRVLGLAVTQLSDVDRDGYGLLGRYRDPDAFDSRVHPFASDVPGNGLDEDGAGGDLPGGLAYREEDRPGPEWRSRQTVVLIALESFRADAVGATLGGRPVTPVLDALSATGASSSRAYSHNGYTVQSRYHYFSGSLAGLRAGSLIDDFKAHGYETAYFSAQDESFGDSTLHVGFDRADVAYDARQDSTRRYTTFSTPGSLAVSFNVLAGRIEEFLSARQRGKPLLLYVNFHDTHFPYHHREIEPLLSSHALPQAEIRPENMPALRETYLNTAANVDRAIGRVIGATRRAVGEEPGVVVFSDHGESLFDQGFLGHGYALNDAQTRIPLIVSGLPVTVVEPFGQTDLRDAIRAAMTADDPRRAATVVRDPARAVFQYLGSIDRPAQIGHVTLGGRALYDFRTRRAQIEGGGWSALEALPEPQAARVPGAGPHLGTDGAGRARQTADRCNQR